MQRHVETKRPRRLHVDDEFEFGGLHHRQVSGLGALEEHALGSPKSYAAFTL